MEKKWFIGIDISKKTLDVVIYVPTKKHADETNYERFLNKEEGYKSLLCWLKKKNMAKKRLVISMENTGIYSFDLCLFLEAASIDYCSFNPLHLKRSLGLVRGKNDRVDAERIAYFAYLHRDELSYSKLSGSSIIRLRDFAAERKRFVKQQAEYKGFLTDRKDCEMTSTIERAAHMVKILDEEIASVEEEMLQIINSDPSILRNYPEIPPEVPLLRRRGGVREGTVRRLRGASCRNFLYLVPLTALIMELNDKKFAVLVDADNISHRKIKDILDEIANYGTPTIKRIYGDFTNPKFAAWKEVLLENSITPIQQYAYTTGKNATDSALIIDAMDILHKEGVDGFCIVSSDSDYTRLASRIRESGREVLGFGEKKTPKPFIKSCDKFIYVEILG